MKKILLATLISAFSIAQAEEALKTDQEKLSYSIGYDMSRAVTEFSGTGDLNLDALILGVKDSFNAKEHQVGEENAEKLMEEFIQKQMEKVQAEMEKERAEAEKVAAENKDKGKKFLEENAKKEGVKVTDSGLQYKVISEGKGDKPKAEDIVKVNYKGSLIDGTIFDESSEPVSFPLAAVIAGWTEGLQLMNVGSKYTFYVPSDLAYGEEGAGYLIGGNQTLIFDVELLEIEKPENVEDKVEDKKVEEAKTENTEVKN